jgi:hypothetical protein
MIIFSAFAVLWMLALAGADAVRHGAGAVVLATLRPETPGYWSGGPMTWFRWLMLLLVGMLLIALIAVLVRYMKRKYTRK